MDHDVSALGRTKTRLSHAKMDGHKGDIYYYEMVEDRIASLQSRLDTATKALREIAESEGKTLLDPEIHPTIAEALLCSGPHERGANAAFEENARIAKNALKGEK